MAIYIIVSNKDGLLKMKNLYQFREYDVQNYC